MSTEEIEKLLLDTSRDFLLAKPDKDMVAAKLLECIPDSDNANARVTPEQAKALAEWASK